VVDAVDGSDDALIGIAEVEALVALGDLVVDRTLDGEACGPVAEGVVEPSKEDVELVTIVAGEEVPPYDQPSPRGIEGP
jgi:hypothetical protein